MSYVQCNYLLDRYQQFNHEFFYVLSQMDHVLDKIKLKVKPVK